VIHRLGHRIPPEHKDPIALHLLSQFLFWSVVRPFFGWSARRPLYVATPLVIGHAALVWIASKPLEVEEPKEDRSGEFIDRLEKVAAYRVCDALEIRRLLVQIGRGGEIGEEEIEEIEGRAERIEEIRTWRKRYRSRVDPIMQEAIDCQQLQAGLDWLRQIPAKEDRVEKIKSRVELLGLQHSIGDALTKASHIDGDLDGLEEVCTLLERHRSIAQMLTKTDLIFEIMDLEKNSAQPLLKEIQRRVG